MRACQYDEQAAIHTQPDLFALVYILEIAQVGNLVSNAEIVDSAKKESISFTHIGTRWFPLTPHSLTHSLTHPLIHSPTHPLTQPLYPDCGYV